MKSIVFFLLSIIVLSCNSDENNSQMVNVASTLIAKGNLYGNGEEGITEQHLIITNQTDWNNLITQMNSVNNVSDSFTEIDIDFFEYMIIAVFDNIKGSGGHQLELNLMSNSESIIVNIIKLAPEGNATTVITQPFHIVKIQKTDLPILFE